MKTFKQILDQIYGQAEVNNAQTNFSEYETDQTLAVQLALSEIWHSDEYSFRSRSTTFTTTAINGVYPTTYTLPYGKIKDKGLKVSGQLTPMIEIQNADTLSSYDGIPIYYWAENDLLNVYPTPDAVYTINTKYWTNYKAKSAALAEKSTLLLTDDILNVPTELEDIFLMALGYKSIVNYVSDPEDEVYIDMLNRYKTALSILKIESKRTSKPPEFVIS
jgi:hypothetical protein